MTWIVVIEFADAQTASMTLTGVTKTLRETGHNYGRAAMREIGEEAEASFPATSRVMQ